MAYETGTPAENTQGDWNLKRKILDPYMLDLVPPTKNTVYTLVDIKGDLEIHKCYMRQDNDELAAKTVDMQCIVDGKTYTLTGQSLVSGTIYLVSLGHNVYTGIVARILEVDDTATYDRDFLSGSALPCRSFKLTVTSKSNNGTNQNLVLIVDIAKV